MFDPQKFQDPTKKKKLIIQFFLEGCVNFKN